MWFCIVLSCHVSRCVLLCYVVSCGFAWCYVALCCVVLYCVVLCCVVLWCIVFSCLLSCYIALCCFFVVICRIVSCCVVSRCVVCHCVMFFYFMLLLPFFPIGVDKCKGERDKYCVFLVKAAQRVPRNQTLDPRPTLPRAACRTWIANETRIVRAVDKSLMMKILVETTAII